MRGRDAINRVSMEQPKLQNKGGVTGTMNPMLNENLSRVIRWYKARTSFECRKTHADYAWQSRFYDHIIRNNKEYNKIKNYIVNNPNRWKDDKFYI